MERDPPLKLTSDEIAAAFEQSAWATTYPPILSLQQAAELAQVPLATVYQWRSQGKLESCSRKVGKHVRIFRDRFIQYLFNGR